MIATEYTMMLEAFMETAKAQNQELIDGAVFIFVPAGGNSNEATLLSWMSDHCKRSNGVVWHDAFIGMIWTLLNSGVEEKVLVDMIKYVSSRKGDVTTTNVIDAFGEGELN